MIGKHKFKVGQRVRPSRSGIAAGLFRGDRRNQGGTVTKVDRFNGPTVRWDWRKTGSSYHPNFITPDRRKS